MAYPMLDDRNSDRPEIDARHEDLAGLAPAWIGVGSHDLFHDEDLAYAGRLKAAGVPCHLEVVDGAFHVFDLLAPKAEVSQSFFNSQCALLRRAFEPAASRPAVGEARGRWCDRR
jgi:acetyl esterase/lipase